ncbi:MAG: hypothetical protein R3F53_09455 [Gammaproteobacteria bacterium]
MTLNPGDRIWLTTAGGGGWGEVQARAPELIAADLQEGWVSPANAQTVYAYAATKQTDED